MPPNEPLLKFYADDVTGATDVLDVMLRRGYRSALFLDPPTPAQLGALGGLQVVGVAGTSRAWSASKARQLLPEVLGRLSRLPGRLLQFKVCSTFDSSPERGNIGVALDVGMEVTGSNMCPISIAAPHLGRYVVFANLFATSGGRIPAYRLDRHPVMSKHPATPMSESDLVEHLQRQTSSPVVSWSLLQEPSEWASDPTSAPVVLFDALRATDLTQIGRAIWGTVEQGQTSFCIGSSGLDEGLADCWDSRGHRRDTMDVPSIHPVSQLLVLSGSCSAVTAGQIQAAMDTGFVRVPLSIDDEFRRDTYGTTQVVRDATHAWRTGASVVIDTCLGPDDVRRGDLSQFEDANPIGEALGEIGRSLLTNLDVGRLMICGGDTSGAVARALGVQVLEAKSQFAPGAPLCLAQLGDRCVEVVLKGGQIGPVDLMGGLRDGRPSATGD